MQIEYSGRYRRLLAWAELKETLINKISEEDDSTILEAVRYELVEALNQLYGRMGELQKEAEHANAVIDSATMEEGAFNDDDVPF
jgi:ppGpp synthetase/RelA/SpoT-type nucleotidyltranferase